MAEEQGFAQARARLEEIVVQVRKKDTSLEQSLDMLEEGVRLANLCTELVDHSEWRPSEALEAAAMMEAESADSGSAEGATGAAVREPGEEAPAEAADGSPTTADSGDAEPVDEGDVEASGGTDAAETDQPADGGRDEYDDIFADEEEPHRP